MLINYDIIKFQSIISSDNLTAQNSLSIKRAPYKSKNYEYVTGKSENVPFMPGGFTINDLLKDSNIMNSETNELDINNSNYFYSLIFF